MKALLLAITVSFSFVAHPQYYYKDIIGTKESSDLITSYRNNNLQGRLTNDDRRELAADWEKRLKNKPGDSVLLQRIQILKDTTKNVNVDSLGWQDFRVASFDNNNYSSVNEYDSLQNAVPEGKKNNWLMKQLIRQSIKANKKYGNSREGVNSFKDSLIHKLPYLLFLSLPFFALILKLLYIRRKNFYYSDHAVFTLYHYILSFVLMLFLFGVSALRDWSDWGIFNLIVILLFFSWPVYLYLQMKKFYQQSHLKTAGKFVLLNVLGFITIIILFVLFLLLSFFQI